MKPIALVVLVATGVSLLLAALPVEAAPDLIIYNMLLGDEDDEAYSGESIQVFVSTKNVGTSDIPTLPHIENGIYLSTNSTITTSDVELLIYELPGLPVDGPNNVWKDVTIPAATAPGTYYVGAIADYNNTVAESNEGNNTGFLPITIELAPNPVISSPKDGNCYFPGTVSFEWSPVTGASGYQIQVATDGGFSSLVMDDTTSGTSYGGGSLTTPDDYWVRVKADNSGWSDTVAFYVVTQAGPALSSPTDGATVSSRRPTLSWGTLPQVRFYHLEVDNAPGFDSQDYLVQTGSTNWTPESDMALGDWHWRVRAFYNEEPDTIIGDFGDEWTFTIGDGPAHELAVTAYADSTTIASGGQVGLSASASDSLAHGIASWEWSDGGAGGTFSPSTGTPNPTWTAPGNDTGSPVTHTLSVAATCDGYTPVSASDTVEVVENPRDPGDPDLIVTNLAVTTPPDPTSGELPQFSVTVMNSGLRAVGRFTVDVYPDMIAPPGSGMRGEGKIQFDGLAGDADETRTCSLVVGGGLRNTWAVVDAGGSIGETDETNNRYGPVNYELSAVPLVPTAFWDFGLTGVAGGSLDLLSLKFASVGGSALEIGAQATAGKGLRYELLWPWGSDSDELHVIRSTRVGASFTADIGSLNLGVIDADAAAAEVGMRQMMALDYRFDDAWTNDDQAAVVTVLSLADLAELGAYEAPIVGPIIAGIIEWETQHYASGYRDKMSCSVQGYGQLGVGVAIVKVGPLDATPLTGEMGASIEGAAKVYSEVNLDPTADVAGEQGLMVGGTGRVGLLFNPSVSGAYTVGFGEQIGWDGNRDSYVCSGERQLTSTTNIAEEQQFWSDRLEIPDATVTAMGDRLTGTVIDALASGQSLPVGPELLASAVTLVTDELRDYSLDVGNEPVAQWERRERTAYGYRIPLNLDIGAAIGLGGSIKLGIEGTALTGVEAVTAKGELRNGEPHPWALYEASAPRYQDWDGFQEMMLDIMPRGIARAAEHIQEFIGSAWESVLAGTTSVVDAVADVSEGATQVIADASGFGADIWVGVESYWADTTAGLFGSGVSVQRLRVPYRSRLARDLQAAEAPVDQEIVIVGRVHCVSVIDDEGSPFVSFPGGAIAFEATVLPSQMLNAGLSGAEMTGLRLFRYLKDQIAWEEIPSSLTANGDGSYLIEASLTKPGEYAVGVVQTPSTGPEPAAVNVWPGQMEICGEMVLGVGAIFRDENGMDDYTGSVLVDRDPVGSLATDLSPLGVYLSVQGDVALEPGSHRLEVTASDLVGSEASARTTFFVVRENTFLDVPTMLWAWQQVEAVKLAGIVQGYEDGFYHPDWAVTRAQMAVYISRARAGGEGNVPELTETPTFTDVPEGYWALKHVEYAVDQGVVVGYGDGTYRPEEPVDRGQMAVYVARAKEWVDIEDDMTTAPELFPDVPTGFWAGTAVEACVDNDVVQGYEDGYYHPDWTVTRDQMAVYIARAFDLTL